MNALKEVSNGRSGMLWLSHITVLIAGIIVGVLFARRNQKKVEKAVFAAKQAIEAREAFKNRRG